MPPCTGIQLYEMCCASATASGGEPGLHEGVLPFVSVPGPRGGESWITALGQTHSQVSLCHSPCWRLQTGRALQDIPCSQLFPGGRELVPWRAAEPGGTGTNSPCLWFKPKPQLWPEHGTVPTLALQGAVTAPTVTAGCTRALLPCPPLRGAAVRGNTSTVAPRVTPAPWGGSSPPPPQPAPMCCKHPGAPTAT